MNTSMMIIVALAALVVGLGLLVLSLLSRKRTAEGRRVRSRNGLRRSRRLP